METMSVRSWIMASDGSGYLPAHDADCPGSFAAVVYPYPNNQVNDSIGIRVGASRIGTTNGQMEVAGCGHGMRAFRKALYQWGVDMKGITLHVVLDAQYVYCAYNEHPTKVGQGFWMRNWKERGWKTSSNRPVENQKLWHFLNAEIELLESAGVTIEWHWVPGHDASLDVRNRLNNRVDSMCTTYVGELRSKRVNDKDYKGEPAWYEVFSSGETPEDMGVPRLTTPRLSLFHHYHDMFQCPTSRVKVITVNTFGVMGRGIAKTFADLYPEGLAAYKVMCARSEFRGRRVNQWYCERTGEYFFFAATKEHWKNPSQITWVTQCAKEIAGLFPQLPADIKKGGVAIPPMGCGNGGLDWAVVKPLVLKELDTIPVVLYEN